MGHVDPFEVMNAIMAIGLTAKSLGASVDIEKASAVCLKLVGS
jgi:hypothetical protein